MDLLSTWSLPVLVSVVFLLFTFKWSISPYALIHMPLPIVGHLHLIGAYSHRSFRTLSKIYGPLMKLQLGIYPAIIVSSPALAKEFLTTHDAIFASRPPLSIMNIYSGHGMDLVCASFGEHWRKMRKITIFELLNPKRIQSFANVRQEELKSMIAKILDAAQKQEITDMSFITAYAFNVVTTMVMSKKYFGMSDKTATRISNLMSSTVDLNTRNYIGNYVPFLQWVDPHVGQMKKVQDSFDSFLQEALDEHRQEKQEVRLVPDFLDILSKTLIDDSEADFKIKRLIQDIFVGGTETSVSTTQWALVELLHQPHILERVQVEIENVVGRDRMVQESDLAKLDFFHAVIKETLRLYPAAPLLVPHYNEEACQIKNMKVGKGTILLINIYAISRDESIWECPEQFNPDRFAGKNMDLKGHDFELLPFGSGRRACPGMHLAMVMLQLGLANLVHGFNWTLPYGRHPMEEGPGATLRLAVPLKLRPSARLPFRAYGI